MDGLPPFTPHEALVDAIMNVDTRPQMSAVRRKTPRLQPARDPYEEYRQAVREQGILGAPIPGANPEVGTLADAMVGVLAAGSGAASQSLGRTPGGGMSRIKTPGNRTAPEPEPTVGMWSGGGPGGMWSRNKGRAESYARNPGDLLYVEVPLSVFKAGHKAARKFGQPTRWDAVLPGEWANKAVKAE